MKAIYIKHDNPKALAQLEEEFSTFGFKIFGKNPEDIEKINLVILIHSSKDVEDLLSLVQDLRSKMGDKQKLWVCAPKIKDNGILEKSGVNRRMEPIGWADFHVAERILADLVEFIPQHETVFGSTYGVSKPMKKLFHRITKIARLDESVLIMGETGAGKGMIAREIHRCSGRPGHEPVKVNSAAFHDDRLETELFGHVRGAYTGADRGRRGLILEANQGSLFLDEIGELALPLQAKLLDAVEDKRIRPIGSNNQEQIHSRLIFATNKDLAQEVAAGEFRADFYQRLRRFELHIPPLRNRRADILLLAAQFLGDFNQKYNSNLKFPENSRDVLFRHDWPGNVRELGNVVSQAAALSDDDDFVSTELLLEAMRSAPADSQSDLEFQFDPTKMTWEEAQTRLKTAYFRKILDATSSKKAAMEISGLSKARFYEIIKELP